MNEAVVFLLAGLSLYAGGHHLYLGVSGRGWPWPHLSVGGLYGLLAGFAIAWGLNLGSVERARAFDVELLSGFGALLWIGLLWHLARLCSLRRLLLLDLLTAAWIFLWLRQLVAATGGHELTPTLFELFHDGGGRDSVAVWTLSATLLGCAYLLYRLYRLRRSAYAWCGLVGVAGLAAVNLQNYLGGAQASGSSSLAPLGFVLFLFPWSAYIGWRNWRRPRPSAPAEITSTLPSPPCFHRDVAQLRAPAGTPATSLSGGGTPSRATLSAAAEQPVDARPLPDPDGGDKVTTRGAVDSATLGLITDSLIDIAVYATMALNRFQRGDADPATLESLCRKIRVQAIQTRRVTHRLLADERDQSEKNDG